MYLHDNGILSFIFLFDESVVFFCGAFINNVIIFVCTSGQFIFGNCTDPTVSEKRKEPGKSIETIIGKKEGDLLNTKANLARKFVCHILLTLWA